jgi:hypothetical protein
MTLNRLSLENSRLIAATFIVKMFVTDEVPFEFFLIPDFSTPFYFSTNYTPLPQRSFSNVWLGFSFFGNKNRHIKLQSNEQNPCNWWVKLLKSTAVPNSTGYIAI